MSAIEEASQWSAKEGVEILSSLQGQHIHLRPVLRHFPANHVHLPPEYQPGVLGWLYDLGTKHPMIDNIARAAYRGYIHPLGLAYRNFIYFNEIILVRPEGANWPLRKVLKFPWVDFTLPTNYRNGQESRYTIDLDTTGRIEIYIR